MPGNGCADQLALRVPVVGTIMMDKGGIMKTLYKWLLLNDKELRKLQSPECLSLKVSLIPVGRGT